MVVNHRVGKTPEKIKATEAAMEETTIGDNRTTSSSGHIRAVGVRHIDIFFGW